MDTNQTKRIEAMTAHCDAGGLLSCENGREIIDFANMLIIENAKLRTALELVATGKPETGLESYIMGKVRDALEWTDVCPRCGSQFIEHVCRNKSPTESLQSFLKADCTRLLYGKCTTRRCLVRGGYIEGAPDYDKATCEYYEISNLLGEL